MSGWVSATGEYHDHGKRLRVRRTTLTDGPGEPAPPDLLVEERAPQSLPAPGERIGPYEVIRELGRGGMGAVFAARDTRLGRRVAIKFFSGDHGPEVTARFILEAKVAARCSHENIAGIHEVGERGGQPFLVLEYLHGAPLTQLLRDGRKLPAVQAVELMVPVVRALTFAHAHNIVHSDLKPDNIFVTDSGTIKVLDFGIAKLVHASDEDDPGRVRSGIAKASGPAKGATRELTRPELAHRGVLVGTLPYMSPEQWCAGGGTVDHQTDLWAVGVILFQMVAGHHPLSPRSGWELMIAGVLEEPMPSVRGACPNLPDELADVIDRCLEKPKARRIGSARELLDALEPLLPGRYVRRLRPDERPYAGITPFQESDAHRFFGRAREVAAAVARLRAGPLLGIVGPSGAGKSSFVRAGIVPALEASGEPWSTLVVRPGRGPMAALAHALAPIVSTGTRTSTSVVSVLLHQQAVVDRLYAEPGFLGAALRSRARSHGQHVLLFVDQFEELYTQGADARERLAFTACLAGVCDDATTPLRLVLSLRSDFLDHVAEAPALLAELTRGLFVLSPPSRDGLRDALIQPAEMAGYQFEAPAMVESMLDHLEHTPGALSLLQFTAGQLWELRDPERGLLTSDSYARLGGIAGIAGAMAGHAETGPAECTAREQEDTGPPAPPVRATRRSRLAVIAAIGLLFALVAAAGAALVMSRDARQAATARARHVEEQLDLTRAERAKAVAANRQLESKNAALVSAIEAAERARIAAERARIAAERARIAADAEEARLRAEEARRHERRSRRRAAEAAQQAREAAGAGAAREQREVPTTPVGL